ncbi:hypothetical protein MKX03_021886 [Papaver bracteatum]|nr:hypothetical protein MKX03_021886 [Papaver bracteatum]
MTDGVQCVTGLEHRFIEDLQAAFPAPAGLKVLIHNVNVRHGCLMLMPEGLKVLGGMVEASEAYIPSGPSIQDLSVEEIDDAPFVWVWRRKKQKKSTSGIEARGIK